MHVDQCQIFGLYVKWQNLNCYNTIKNKNKRKSSFRNVVWVTNYKFERGIFDLLIFCQVILFLKQPIKLDILSCPVLYN